MRRRWPAALAAAALAAGVAPARGQNDPSAPAHPPAPAAAAASAGNTTRVSTASGGAQASGGGPSVVESVSASADGQVIAFASNATNLVPDDTNGVFDVFVYEVASGETTRLSVGADGSEVQSPSTGVAISGDGNVVAFVSASPDLADGDTNGVADVFVRDRTAGTTSRVSVATTGGREASLASGEPALSQDGRWVAFASPAPELWPGDANGVSDVFLHDRDSAVTTRVSVDRAGEDPDGPSQAPDISADGTVVAFESQATDLLAGEDGNSHSDVFVADPATHPPTITRVNVGAPVPEGGDSTAPSLSADGRYVAYTSAATNIAPPDTPGTDVFVFDRTAGTTRRVSVGPSGAPAPDGPSHSADVVSADPDVVLVAFTSEASNLTSGDTNGTTDVFVRDVNSDRTTRESLDAAGGEAGGTSGAGRLAADGAVIVFASNAGNLTVSPPAPGTTEVFRRERASGSMTRVSGPGGTGVADGAEGSSAPTLSAGGGLVAFSSQSPDLVAGDTNRVSDVFVHDRRGRTTTRIGLAPDGAQPDGAGTAPAMSADGRFVAFASEAANLVADDTNGVSDVFLWDAEESRTIRLSVPADLGVAGAACEPAISGDGTTVAFSVHPGATACDDDPAASEVFVHRQGEILRITGDGDGTGSDGPSGQPAVSADGRAVAFSSAATNLTSGDTNEVTDIFVADLGTTHPVLTRVSVGPDGAQAGADSTSPALSADGRIVAFVSRADDLVVGDTDDDLDIFVHDRRDGLTTRVDSLPAAGDAGEPALSTDGQVVAFTFEPEAPVDGSPIATDVLRHDRRSGTTISVTTGPGGMAADSSSFTPAVSINGAVVAFASEASNLVAGDTNGVRDVFVHDLRPEAGLGYRLVAADGGVFAFGAPFLGSTGDQQLNRPIVAAASSPGGRGYWFVASDGGVFSFGDAGFFGSTGSMVLNKPVVGMAPTPTGGGYWLVASDGGIFAFGDAGFFGSTGDVGLNRPIVGMAPTPSGGGYWLVASDGGIFAFGDAPFAGSTGALTLNRPVVGMAPTPSGGGYWLVASDGGIFAFGGAGFFGSTGDIELNAPIVAMIPR